MPAMLNNAPAVTPLPAALPPVAPAAQPPLPGAPGGPSFAKILNDQPTALPPPPAQPAPREPESAGSETKAATHRQVGPAARQPAKPGPDKTAKPEAAPPAVDSQDADKGDVAAADESQDPETSGLDEFTQLIGLSPQALPAPPAPAAAGDGDATDDDPTAARHGRGRIGKLADDEAATAGPRGGTEAAHAGERRPADAPGRAADAARAKGMELAADKAAARSAASESQQTAAAAGHAAAPQAAPATPPASFAAVLAQALPLTAAAPDAAPLRAGGSVHAALHSHAFGPELGARVSLMAVDGVQRAELQLNPADMGPVAVQIVVDGAQAQVSFHAAQAETRQALEQSLPDLAAALQGQGLTLSGGGVFQQAQKDAQAGDAEGGGPGEGRDSRTNAAGGRVAADGPVAPARRSVGLLDAFA